MSKTVSLLSALLCTFIWGTTFIAQDTGMDDIGPFTFNAVRFFVGFLAIAPLVVLFEIKKFKSEFRLDFKTFVILSLLIGLSLFLGSALQQVALLYTDVANAAFFTIFYVPMVPIIIFLFGRKSIHWSVWPSVILCLIGGYLLTNFYDATVRLGDTLVVLGALFWSTHIIFTGIMIDVNQGWTVEETIKVCPKIESYEPEWLEEPIMADDFDGYDEVCNSTTIPIVTGENNFTHHDLLPFMRGKKIPILQPDIMRGGYTNLIYSAKLANKFGIKIAPHMFPELSIHIVASIENPSWLEYMGWYDHLWKEPILPKNGTLTPTSRPGHGMDFKTEIGIF